MIPTITLNLFNLLILFGAFQGIILGIILLSTQRLRKTSNAYLALMMIVFAFINLQNTANAANLYQAYPILEFIQLDFMTLIPLSLYFFITYLLKPNYQIQKRDYFFFAFFLFELCLRLFWMFWHMIPKSYTDSQRQVFFWLANTIEFIAAILTFILIVKAIKQLKIYEKELYNNYAEIEGRNLSWLRNTFIAGLFLTGIWFFLSLSDYSAEYFSRTLAYTVWLGVSILILWIGYSTLIQQGLLDTTIFAISEKPQEPLPPASELSSKTDEHYERILHIIAVDKLYQNPDLSMSLLSEKSELSNGYVSQIINQKRKQNFFDFINSYRVEDVKLKIVDPKYDHYTLLGLAQDAGFKSKSTFNAVFKKMTGQTPSQYRKAHS